MLPESNRRTLLERWLDNETGPWFGDRILPVTVAIAERWGVLAANARRLGTAAPVIDGLIAATALENDLVLVTRNVSDFEALGVEMLDPWK